MNIYISSGSFQSGDLGAIVSICSKHTLKLELSSGFTCNPDFLNQLNEITSNASQYLVHNYFPPPPQPFVLNLASERRELLDASLRLCRQAIDLCSVLHSPFYSVHAGFALNLEPGDLGNPLLQRKRSQNSINRNTALDIFAASVMKLSKYAQERGVELLVENNVTTAEIIDVNGESPLLLSRPDEIRCFFDNCCSRNVGLLLDVAHAKVSAKAFKLQPELFFELLGPHIKALHLSDNDGLRDSNRPFGRDAWFAPFLPAYAARPMVLEVYGLEVDNILAQKRLLEELIVREYPPLFCV